MNAICLLCRQPDRIWLSFLNDFRHYKVFIMVDDYQTDMTDLKEYYSNIEFIQVSDEYCIEKNYTKINYFVKKDITSWERALLFFNYIEKTYDKIWLIEDDVFFNDETVLIKIDEKYKHEDLLTRFSHIPKDNIPGWGPVQSLEPNLRSAMCCVVRMSRKMLDSLDNFVKIEKRFCFLEILFPTLATNLNLDYKNPSEMLGVRFNPDREIKKKVFTDVLYTNLFHPVKDIYLHKIYREGILH